MVADHTNEPRSSMSLWESNASSLFTRRGNAGSNAAASNTRRHSTYSLHRFPSLTSVTELFQGRPRARLGPTHMRRKITHLFNPNQHRRSSSDTAFLSADIASARQGIAAPVVPPPLPLGGPSFVDNWSYIARDIECAVSSRRHPTSSASIGTRPYSYPAPISSAAPIIFEEPPSLAMPPSHRRHRSSAGRRSKQTITKELVVSSAKPSTESISRALSAIVEISFETDVVDIVGCPSTS